MKKVLLQTSSHGVSISIFCRHIFHFRQANRPALGTLFIEKEGHLRITILSPPLTSVVQCLSVAQSGFLAKAIPMMSLASNVRHFMLSFLLFWLTTVRTVKGNQDGIELTHGEVQVLSGSIDEKIRLSFPLHSSAQSVYCAIGGGSGDADLLARMGTPVDFDQSESNHVCIENLVFRLNYQ